MDNGYHVKELGGDPNAVVDGIRDTPAVKGAGWSRVALVAEAEADPFKDEGDANRLAARCRDLGFPATVVPAKG